MTDPDCDGAKATILVVDDDATIRELTGRWLLAEGYRPLYARNAAEAWETLQFMEVDLAIFDVRLPDESGLRLLSRTLERFPELPILMMTASMRTSVAVEALTAGAYGYLIKPVRQEELALQVARGLDRARTLAERRAYAASLEARVRRQTRQVRRAQEETIRRLSTATMCRDEETGAHVVRTGLFSEALARAAGWSADDAERIRFAAPMHDIGKIGIPDAILRKSGKLSFEEYEIMKTHTTIGASILEGSQSPILRLARTIAQHHHERWDGSGYPCGLAAKRIPEAARIVAIVDVYDALTHDRVYRPAMSVENALRTMREQEGAHFDPKLLQTFFSVIPSIQDLAERHPDGPSTSAVSIAASRGLNAAEETLTTL